MSKLIVQATKAKALGYTHISSVVKRYKFTTYYHVVPINSILAAGKWIAAGWMQAAHGGMSRCGVSIKHVPETCISRINLWNL